MRLYTAFIAAMLLAPGATYAGPSCDSTRTVGSWNIQYFGQPAKAGKSTQAPADIADYIAASGVDVLALAEISATTKSPQARNARMDDVVKALDSKGGAWRYELYPKREGSREPEDQWTGVLWNSARVQHIQTHPVPMTINPAKEAQLIKGYQTEETVAVWSRRPHAAKFSAGEGQTDFVVVPLHMKSNTGDSESTSALGKGTSAVRKYEAELLAAAIPQLRTMFNDDDLIFLGDTNMRVSGEPAGRALQYAGFRDCNAKDQLTHLKGGKFEGSPFDRIYVVRSQRETIETCSGQPGPWDFNVMWPSKWRADMTEEAFRSSMSDHVLVSTKLCVMKDDD